MTRRRPGPSNAASAATAAIVALLTFVLGTAALALTGPAAGATGDSSGGAGASGGGDTIISSILRSGGSGGHPSATANGTGSFPAPVCLWHTLTDIEVVFLLHVAAAMPELQDSGLFRALTPWLAAGPTPGFDLQVMFCDGVPRTDQVRLQPTAVTPTDVATAARRRLITRLPPPELVVSPPFGVAALVHEPVFVSVAPAQWTATVSDVLTDGGRTVEVQARPARVELTTGEPGLDGRLTVCNGPGRPFDPADRSSVEAQAADPGACVLRYARATSRDGRRPQWFGYALLRWDGRYRIDGGAWQPLDDLFSFRVFGRSVGEADTAIQRR